MSAMTEDVKARAAAAYERIVAGGRKGGQATSERKVEAVKENLKKARKVRHRPDLQAEEQVQQ